MARAVFQEVRVGLLGLGTVGSGVAEILHNKRAGIEREIGLPVRLARVLVRDLNKRRGFAVDSSLMTSAPAAVVESDDVNMVVEAMGSEEPAGDYLRRAMKAGKQVITANKE